MSESKQNSPSAMVALLPSFKHLIAGGVAGAISRTCVSPLERLKILFQIQSPGSEKYQGIFRSLKMMYTEEGIAGWFKGNGTNVIRMLPYSAVQFAAYEQFKKMMIPKDKTDLTPFTRLIAGALAGIASVSATYPLDLIRTRLAAQNNAGTSLAKYQGIAHCTKLIIRDEGWLALYKGISPTIWGIAPYVGLNFMCYESLKAFVRDNINPTPNTAELLTCGGVAGAVAQTITYPLDVLRRKMQMQGVSKEHPVYRNTFHAIRHTYQTDSIKGFYRGLIPNYLKVVPSIAISFVVYERLKQIMGG
eukprot:TRINITY_DN8945_c0_g1_i1.p1 TRINITY_DN8945_c0_g1~~TRINITY_DN8945_c0_g1_i1.p1  ORF type:complete len:304 (-),score=47.14 TRINITY_DN8945_c0_g1_i1:9-920(-)